MESDTLPMVSVLIAARNEENNISACLESITKLDYPVEKFQVLVGDDDSDDSTAEIIAGYCAKYKNIFLFRISTRQGQLNGKSNVLAQLSYKATGDIFLVTDADVTLNPGWAKEMVRHLRGKAGIVAGLVIVEQTSLFARLQNADFLFNLSNRHTMSNFGLFNAASGGNMAISREAYRKVGGYENIPFSITEDFALCNAVKNAGYSLINCFNEKVTGITVAEKTFSGYVNQQTRWLESVFRQPKLYQAGVVLQSLTFPLLILTIILFGYPVPVTIFICKWFTEIMILFFACRKLSVRPDISIFIYTCYASVVALICILAFWLGPSVSWKGRDYKRDGSLAS